MAFSNLPMNFEEALREVKMWREKYRAHRPQAREWVGLDHDDIHHLVNEFFYRGMQPTGIHFANFGRAIEAKLKEKNS